ncbi:ABC transporter permease, partial [Bacteroidota bacterium]
MIRNYLTIAIRNIVRHKSFSFMGLAISMSTCLLVIMVLADLKSYDQFHTNKDRIYRLLTKPEGSEANGTTPYPLGDAIMEEYHGIESMVRIRSWVGGDVKYNDNVVPLSAYYASKDFLKVFDFILADGNKYKALEEPFSIVLTHETAEKLFKGEDPVGKQVSFIDKGVGFLGLDIGAKENDLGSFIITGVLDEKPYKSHFEFEALFSFSTLESLAKEGKESIPYDDWKSYWSFYHYIMLKEGVLPSDVEPVLSSISDSQYAPFENLTMSFKMEPLTKITPGKMISNPISLRLPIEAFYFLAILAIIVIFSACFNYTNLSIAKALSRAREVGIRKISGAYRKQIFFQFISEAIVISLIALILAIGLLQVIKLGFSGLWLSKHIQIHLDENLLIALAFILFSLITGIVAGLLPAIYLSSFKPAYVLKSDFGSSNRKRGGFLGKAGLGKTLIVAQFAISLLFIITATLVYFQLNYVMN